MAKQAVVVAKRLGDALRSKGVSFVQASKTLGVSEATIRKWLSGTGVTPKHQSKLAKFLGTSVDDLILRDEQGDGKGPPVVHDMVSVYKANTITNLYRQIDLYEAEVKQRRDMENLLADKLRLLREEIQIKQRLIDEAGIVDAPSGT